MLGLVTLAYFGFTIIFIGLAVHYAKKAHS